MNRILIKSQFNFRYILGKALKPFIKGGEVSNYPTKTIDPEDKALLNKISLKRKMEIISKAVS